MNRCEKQVLNAITVDVEDWFQVAMARNETISENWASQNFRVIPNMCKILKLFDEFQVKGTFFVMGWLAERHPEIVLTIKKHGHEIGSYGYSHKLVYEISRKEFENDLDMSISILERITNEKIYYHRAPSYSITENSLWALEALSERGIVCDSSIFPVKHDIYGMTNAPRFPFRFNFNNGNKLIEFPPSTISLFGRNLPFAGGGYLRLFPFWVIRKGIQKLNRMGEPANIYFQPWELDHDLPKVRLNLISKFRHYTNLEITELRLRNLLSEFRFGPIGKVLESYNFQTQASVAGLMQKFDSKVPEKASGR